MAQVTIVTALFNGTDYGIPHSQHIYDATWVNKLYNGCKRNSTIPFEMVCLVDRQYDIQAPVRQVLFQSQADKTAGWALLTELYRPDLTDGPDGGGLLSLGCVAGRRFPTAVCRCRPVGLV